MAAHYFPGSTISKRYTTLRDATHRHIFKGALSQIFELLKVADPQQKIASL